MEKRIIVLLFLAVVAVGCSDNFLSSENGPVPTASGRIIFNQYELQYIAPFQKFVPTLTGIATTSLDSRGVSLLVTGSALLADAPRAGKILYFQVSPISGDIELLVSNSDGKNTITVTSFQNINSPQLQDAALSPDGHTVAYVRSETQIKAGRKVYISSLILFDMLSQDAFELDNFTSFLGGPNESEVRQFISQLEFSPNGTSLGVAQWGGNTLISVYDVSSRQRTIRTSPGTGAFFTWASDSQTLFYTRNRGSAIHSFTFYDSSLEYKLTIPSGSDIRALNIVTSTDELIEKVDSAVMELDLSPMDSALVYSRFTGFDIDPFGCDLAVKNLHDGTNTRMLTSSTEPISRMHPQWSADGNSILFTEYIVLSSPNIFPSSINQINTKTGRNIVIANNAYGGYWMP